MPQDRDLATVAAVLKPHGLKGAVRIELASDNPERFRKGARLLIVQGERIREAQVERFVGQGRYGIVKLSGFDSPEQAREIRGAELAIEAGDLPPLPQGSYYTFQILGMEVRSAAGESLGRIVEIEAMPACDVYRVEGALGGFGIPAQGDIIQRVDAEHGFMVIDDREGLR
jgi:16S rRNA processing protein RimM